MERVLQWLDDLEDLVFCVPMLWVRLRGWIAFALLAGLAALLLPMLPSVLPWLLAALLPFLGLALAGARQHAGLTDNA